MEVTRIADLPPVLMKIAEYNSDELDFVNAFTKIQGASSNGSGASRDPGGRAADYY
jgi:hypothetical protein